MAIGRKRSELGGSGKGQAEIIRQVGSLFSGFNAAKGDADEYKDGQVGEEEPLLSLEIEDDELLRLSTQWRQEYEIYEKDIKNRQKRNYEYWKGDQYATSQAENRGVDNIIFEAIETLLPIISRQNPEPVVSAEDSDDGLFIADATVKILAKKADETRLKSKVKKAARQWCIYFLACFKMGWDEITDDMYFQTINPERLILDPRGEFDGAEFKGRYVGEYKTATAEELSNAFPKFKEIISASVEGKMGTTLGYHEWWTNEYVFWRYQNIILDKRENPYWNGEEEKPTMNEMGEPGVETVTGVNHFAAPKMPYAFLSVFNTGKQPHDETSLIEQVISLQDIVNKRLRQIDKNADDTNNGWVFNQQFSQDQGKSALEALKNGGAIIAPTENINDSVQRMQAPALADYVYQDLIDKREQVYNIMGVRGSTAQGIISERTVRGKIEIKGQDVDRLALVIEQIEQFVDHLYNLAVQTIYVYYTPEQAARALGVEDGARYIQLLKSGPSRRLVVSVKEGSTIPQDSLTRRNEAIDLWNAKALDPETFFERLDFPDPKEAAKKAIQYQLDPASTLQELGGVAPVTDPMAPPADPMAAAPNMIPLNL